jgi:hypothetical protein
MLPSQFKALADMLRAESSAIQKAIQNHTKSIGATKEGEHKEQEIRQKWREDILTEYKKTEGDRTTSDNRQYGVQNSLRWATWFAFIAASAYAAIAAFQLCTSQRQLQQMITANTDAETATQTDERAWVTVSDMKRNAIPGGFSVIVWFANSGKTRPTLHGKGRR